jgi:hypothetical protein
MIDQEREEGLKTRKRRKDEIPGKGLRMRDQEREEG